MEGDIVVGSDWLYIVVYFS